MANGSTGIAVVDARSWQSAWAAKSHDDVVVEAPLTIWLETSNGRHMLGSTMRTPGHDSELAVGLAVAESVVSKADDITDIVRAADSDADLADAVTLVLAAHVLVDPASMGRVTRPTSACGVCGREELDALRIVPVERRPPAPDVLAGLPDAMAPLQPVFATTGGLHAAAIVDADGAILCVREDVGRHNAVDKVVGFALLNGLEAAALVVSGRAGYEIVQKAAAAGIPALASVSATTSLAIEAAQTSGITLACFVRKGRMTVYNAPQWTAERGETR